MYFKLVFIIRNARNFTWKCFCLGKKNKFRDALPIQSQFTCTNDLYEANKISLHSDVFMDDFSWNSLPK